MGTVVILMFVFFCITFVSAYKNMDRMSAEMLSRAVRPMQNNFAPPPSNVNPKFSPIFTVELERDNEIADVQSSFDMEYSFYEEITKTALSKNKETDIIKLDYAYFKYKKAGNTIVFLDISKEINMLFNMIYTFLWIALPMLIIIFLISLYFANRSIKPIEITYNKQKEFIADASHELKTPLAAIDTNVDVLLDISNAQQQKWLSYIKTETSRMANLTGSLLYLTKMDYDKSETEKEDFDLGALITDVLIPLEAVFYEKNIRVEQNITSNLRINGNSEQIRRLVGILVDNAIKYTNGRIRISLEKGQGIAKLTVYNTGAGIPSDEIDKIWDRFYRCDKSREYIGGFGLGLPIAKSIADVHKGKIVCESSVDEWTRFIVLLPLA